MSAEFTYKCDHCAKVLGHDAPERQGNVWDPLAKTLLTSGSTGWHACSDLCLCRLLEGWIAKIKARVAAKLDDERAIKYRAPT